ncbi:MAG: hypothetical protein EOO51_11890 [Flavobacterium sp.]|nr:MAG: hypothetical protein EOO51_11890 [Flavobacterium sp.]
MKRFFLLSAMLAAGCLQAETIPGPFWFNLSEKILTETHQLIGADAKPTVKVKTKAHAVKNTLKCQAKKEIELPSTPYFTITGSGIWVITD